jgi:hypothetical protein
MSDESGLAPRGVPESQKLTRRRGAAYALLESADLENGGLGMRLGLEWADKVTPCAIRAFFGRTYIREF